MREVTVTLEGRSARIPEMWLAGACHNRPGTYQEAMMAAIRRWFEQEDMERAYRAQRKQGSAS